MISVDRVDPGWHNLRQEKEESRPPAVDMYDVGGKFFDHAADTITRSQNGARREKIGLIALYSHGLRLLDQIGIRLREKRHLVLVTQALKDLQQVRGAPTRRAVSN
jgi:hypothetical protein